jgi:CubicO group peptidase (beta-lactamase class C family)
MVIDQGLISSVDDKACLYLSDWDCDEVVCLSLDCPKARSEISIRDLLEMRSGLEDENIGGLSIYSSTDNQLFFALNRLAVKTRGTEFLYSNSDSMILSGILENATGMTVKELAERDLFSTIGMTGDWWSDKEGHTMTYCCIDATSRDFARFGLLFARNGMWQDTQVITQEWVTESTSPAEGLSYYGLHWWVYPVSMISSGKANMFAAQGLHTNDIWINQPLDLVVVRNSDFTRYGTDSIRTGSNIHSTNPPDSWDNTEFLTYITDSINQ